MPSEQSHRSGRASGGGRVGKKSAGSVAVLLLLALYAFLQPRLNERLGWNLPGLADSSSAARQAELEPVDDVPVAEPPAIQSDDQRGPAGEPPSTQSESNPRAAAGEQRPSSPSRESNTEPIRGPPKEASRDDDSASKLRYGLLREIRPDQFLSPAGLLYRPGSAEGHRLEHVRRHTEDQPSRPGKHGVFDGGMEGMLATIDDAYSRAKKNQRTTKDVDRGRTIYTVDMGRRVGYVGGRDGNRQGKPMARRVKLVLEGTQVITAYPL